MNKFTPNPNCECQHLKDGETLLSNGMIFDGVSSRECTCHKMWRSFSRRINTFSNANTELDLRATKRDLPPWFDEFNSKDCNIAIQGTLSGVTKSEADLDVERALFELAISNSFTVTNINTLCSAMNRTLYDEEAPFTGIDILVIKNCEILEAFSLTDIGRFTSFVGGFNGKIIFLFDGELKDVEKYKYFRASSKQLMTYKYANNFEEAKKSLWD